MAKEWINHYISDAGTWSSGQPLATESYVEAAFTAPSRVRIYESARSGFVMWGGSSGQSYGDAEVYLKILFSDRPFRYLSAPLGTDIDVLNVNALQLFILYSRAIPGAASVPYRAYVNAHCVYEVL